MSAAEPAGCHVIDKPLTEVCKDSRGNTLFVEDNPVGGHTYWSDEIGGGTMVWDTALVSAEMVLLALAAELNPHDPPLAKALRKISVSIRRKLY